MLMVPARSAGAMLELLLGRASFEGLDLRLFTNDKQVEETDDASDYVEAISYGYESQPLSSFSWEIEEDVAQYPEVTFAFQGNLGNVFGYYVTQTGSRRLMWAERFPTAPYVVSNVGDQIRVTPRIEMFR